MSESVKIRGNTVGTPIPRPDWNQTDPNKADFIKNKPGYATYDKAGFVQIRPLTGLDCDEGGLLAIDPAGEEGIKNQESRYNPIVPALLAFAVRQGLIDPKNVNWTDLDRAAALATLGAVSKTGYATTEQAGIVRVGAGLKISGNLLTTFAAAESSIDGRANSNAPITPRYFDYALRAALTNPKNLTWSEENKADARDTLGAASDADVKKAELIAKGRATGYVFDTLEDLDAWLSDPANTANLVLGDNLYIRATDVPDYWWDGTQKQILETQKVDLSEYVKNTDYATATKAGIVKPNPGFYIDSNGGLSIIQAVDDDFILKNNKFRPITSNNLDKAVKAGVTTNTIELTDEEKANACSWMGAVKEQHPTFSDGSIRGYAYCINPSGEQVLLPTTIVATANTIALRNPAGNFYISTPTLQYECANKGYVDNRIAELTARIVELENKLAAQ